MTEFQDKLKAKMHEYVTMVYAATKKFPADELYGVTSQLRRAALSVILNYIEGYARGKSKVTLNFYETAYGSLKESKYLVFFSHSQSYMTKTEYDKSLELAEEIGKMLWTEIERLK